ncbi:hypothetical protein LJR034_005336 [Caballeronia sp. LjRoot34]|uniref:hypothetical protein n=1 Tax=Caballeronia sp. LjRoot34 TaxID=3342325 RepID=UPI003ECC3B16
MTTPQSPVLCSMRLRAICVLMPRRRNLADITEAVTLVGVKPGIDHQMQYGRSGHRIFDMSGTDRVRGETTSMTFHYDQLVDAPEIAARLNAKRPQAN